MSSGITVGSFVSFMHFSLRVVKQIEDWKQLYRKSHQAMLMLDGLAEECKTATHLEYVSRLVFLQT
jgi:hypothetical protein